MIERLNLSAARFKCIRMYFKLCHVTCYERIVNGKKSMYSDDQGVKYDG